MTLGSTSAQHDQSNWAPAVHKIAKWLPQTIDLLVVVVVFVWLPMFVEVKGVDAGMCRTRGNVRRARSGARRRAGRVV